MHVRDLIASLIRRWYVALGGLLITAGLCVLALQVVPVTYESSGSMLMLPPKSSVGSRGNPYLYLGGLGQAVEVLTARMNANDVRGVIQTAHPGATFTLGPDTTTTGPIMKVTASAASADEAMTVVNQVIAAAPTTLQTLQDELSVPENSRLTITTLTLDDQATAVTKTQSRAVIALAGVGVAGTVLLTGLLDGLLTARASRRAGISPVVAEWPDAAEGRRSSDPTTERKDKKPAAAGAGQSGTPPRA